MRRLRDISGSVTLQQAKRLYDNANESIVCDWVFLQASVFHVSEEFKGLVYLACLSKNDDESIEYG